MGIDATRAMCYHVDMSTIVNASPDASPPPVMAYTGNAWDRLPSEPTEWYERFDRYYRPTPNRTLLGAYNAWRVNGCSNPLNATGVSASWQKAFRLYQWGSRAAAYDDHQRSLNRAVEEQARIANRALRVQVLNELLVHAQQALPVINWDKSSGSQLAHAIKTATAELRIDHHDVPATQHNVDVRAILAVLPVELRAVVAQTLKDKG